MKTFVFPILFILSVSALANPYPKPQECWFLKVPPGSQLTVKSEIEVPPTGYKLLSVLPFYDVGNRPFLRGYVWIQANFAEPRSAAPIPKKTKFKIIRINAFDPPIKNCIRVQVDHPMLVSLDFCTDTFELTDLRVVDFKKVSEKFLSLDLLDPNTKTCWIPQP